MQKTLIVGNAPTRRLPDADAAFAHIVRFNDYRLDGKTGTRTDTHITAVGQAYKGQGRQLLTIRPADLLYTLRYTCPTAPVLPCPPIGDGHHASSGLTAILHFLAAGHDVSIIGFDHGATGSPARAHDWHAEAIICQELWKRHLITYL